MRAAPHGSVTSLRGTKMNILKPATLAVFGLTSISSAAQPEVEAFRIADFAHHVALTDPQVSPDQKRVAYVRMSANKDLRYQYEIVLEDLVQAERSRLTAPGRYAHTPRWVSNDELSVLALTKDTGHQVFLLDVDNAELKQVTHHANSVQGYAWSPDRTQLAYASRPKKEPSRVKAFQITKFSTSPPKVPQSLHLLNVSTNEDRRLPDASPLVDRWSAIDWAPDASRLLYTRENHEHYDEYSNDLVEFVLATGEERKLGTGAYPRYSPRGDKVLFLAREAPDYAVGPRKTYTLDTATGKRQRVPPNLDRETLGRFAPDGRVLLNGPELDAQRLWLADASETVQLDLGGVEPVWPLQASIAGSTLAFVGATASSSQELYVFDGHSTRRVTNENVALTGGRKRGNPEALLWRTRDGMDISGIALFPPGFQEGVRYPLVVSPHGGPHTTSTVVGVANNLVNQTMASRGWIVLSPNYRGSTNQGRDFHLVRRGNANYNREVVADVMSGIGALNEQCGCVDTSRKAILGTSYGGMVAAWATALHPTEWVASVVGNASLDDTDSYVRSDQGAGVPTKYGGSPWSTEFSDAYRMASPIYAAEKIQAPTLIVSTLRDPRVPVIQSFKFWKALEDNGVEVEFIAYDMSGHGPSDLPNAMDYWQRAIDWISFYFDRA